MVAVYYVVLGCYCGCGVLCGFRVLLWLRCATVIAGCYCGCGVLL